MIFKYFNIGWILKILVIFNQKFVLDNQKETLKTKKVNYLVKFAVFSEKWWDLYDGFKGQKRLRAIWKRLFKITLLDACFSMSFLNFKPPLLQARIFEKQHVKA